MKQNKYAILLLLTLSSCISTKNIPEGDQLFTGLSRISYDDQLSGQHVDETKEEVEAALATAPNGALFGSSYYHVPFSWLIGISLIYWVFYAIEKRLG